MKGKGRSQGGKNNEWKQIKRIKTNQKKEKDKNDKKKD